MKIYVFALLVVAAVAFARNVPGIEDEAEVLPQLLLTNEDESLNVEVEPVVEHHRERRATCDLLSGLGWNHSACAAHCIVLNRTGGYCNGQGVCICRNKKIVG